MAAKAKRSLVVLSADEERCARIHSLCQQEDAITVRWLSDPLELSHLMQAEENTATLAPHATGLILDLTMPSTTFSHTITQSRHKTDRQVTTITIESARMEWYTVALLALVRISHKLPCLIVSDYSQLRRTFALLDITVVGQIASDASDTIWRTKLRVLLGRLATIQAHIVHVSSVHAQITTRTNANISLRPDLQLDLDSAVLYNAGEVIALSAREVALLTILLHAPGRYLKSSYLADQLTPSGATFPLEEHSVEQMISALRRKMSETAQHDGVLRNRRGLGYAIFPLKQGEQAVEPARARRLDFAD